MCFVACASACGVTVAPTDGDRDGSVPDATPRDSDVTAQADSEAAVVPVVGPTSQVTIVRIRTGTLAGRTALGATLFAEDAEGRVIREEHIGDCIVRTVLLDEYVSAGPLEVFVRDLHWSVAPGLPTNGYVASWTAAEQPSENDLVRVESASGGSFPRFALSSRFPGPLTVRAPRGLPARLPFSASGPMSFAWDPPSDSSLPVHIFLGGSPMVSCFVPAAAGRFDVPQQVLDVFRARRPAGGRIGLARVSLVQVGNRLIRYRLQDSAYDFEFE